MLEVKILSILFHEYCANLTLTLDYSVNFQFIVIKRPVLKSKFWFLFNVMYVLDLPVFPAKL